MSELQKMIITIVVFGVSLAGLLVGLYFQVAKIGIEPFKGPESIAVQMDEMLNREEQARADIEMIPAKKKELAGYQRDKETAKTLVPADVLPEKMMLLIVSKAREAGVSPTYLKPIGHSDDDGDGAEGLEGFSFAMRIKGTFDDIGKFINLLEEFEISGTGGEQKNRYFEIEKLEINAKKKGMVESGGHKVDLLVKTYRYNTAAVAGGTP